MKERSMSESLAKGIAKQVISNIQTPAGYSYAAQADFAGVSHRKKCKLLRKRCRTSDVLSLIDERYPESSKWEMLWGEWCCTRSDEDLSVLPGMTTDTSLYRNVGFDLSLSLPKNAHDYFLVIGISQHALERVILRSGDWLNNPKKVFLFMNKYLKPLVRLALQLIEAGDQQLSSKHEVVIDDFFFVVALNKAINRYGTMAYRMGIITAMPKDYEGASKATSIDKLPGVKTKIMDYDLSWVGQPMR